MWSELLIEVLYFRPPQQFYREHPVKHLSGYQGWVHADGYAGFNGVFGEGKATEVACMAHIRRKFVDVFAAQGVVPQDVV